MLGYTHPLILQKSLEDVENKDRACEKERQERQRVRKSMTGREMREKAQRRAHGDRNLPVAGRHRGRTLRGSG